jgi:hypothetical protein
MTIQSSSLKHDEIQHLSQSEGVEFAKLKTTSNSFHNVNLVYDNFLGNCFDTNNCIGLKVC